MSKACESCGKRIELAGTGRPKRFCGQTCRKRASRAPKTGLPVELTSRARWVRRQGKRPLTAKGWFASVTDPRTWATHDEVKASTKGDGIGFVLGDGVGCIDLDHCIVNGELQGWARDILDRCPQRSWKCLSRVLGYTFSVYSVRGRAVVSVAVMVSSFTPLAVISR